ncbi:hypothetical protein BCR34DRAFT_565978 [Clohesyomyces aquaticus]|uniref:Uncharacterized protein n=1 Tax=Clohesyomyces aquaticus TaxID=1231657 RepID=A0A1Y1ZL90_9PLEO|nr:hypothetical protein BCR34DRAFT_565978 [Clohesyomyces aquaticus]
MASYEHRPPSPTSSTGILAGSTEYIGDDVAPSTSSTSSIIESFDLDLFIDPSPAFHKLQNFYHNNDATPVKKTPSPEAHTASAWAMVELISNLRGLERRSSAWTGRSKLHCRILVSSGICKLRPRSTGNCRGDWRSWRKSGRQASSRGGA